jgi:fatty acid desaturase
MSDGPRTEVEAEETATPEPDRAVHHLSLPMRIALVMFGWVLVLLGIAGLALPGLQGILLLIAGGAVLSVASDTVHDLLRRLLHRWPKLERRFDHLRDAVHDRFARRKPN